MVYILLYICSIPRSCLCVVCVCVSIQYFFWIFPICAQCAVLISLTDQFQSQCKPHWPLHFGNNRPLLHAPNFPHPWCTISFHNRRCLSLQMLEFMDPGSLHLYIHFTLAVTDETLQDTQLGLKLMDIPWLRFLSLSDCPPGYSIWGFSAVVLRHMLIFQNHKYHMCEMNAYCWPAAQSYEAVGMSQDGSGRRKNG